MLSVEIIQTLYHYNAWANTRVLDTTEQLNEEQFTASVGASFPSVRDTLAHTMSAQRNWLARFRQQALPLAINSADYPRLNDLRRVWAVIEADTQSFVKGVTEDDLARVIHYINSQGTPCAYPLWQMMVHQANHAAQHRSEVAVMLTQFGFSPGGLDFLVYIDSMQK